MSRRRRRLIRAAVILGPLAYLLFVIVDDIVAAPQADVEEFVLRRACIDLVRFNTTPTERFEIWRDPVIPTETGVLIVIDAAGVSNDNRSVNRTGRCLFDRVTSSVFSTYDLVLLRVILNEHSVVLPIAEAVRPSGVRASGRVVLAPVDWLRYWLPIFGPDFSPRW